MAAVARVERMRRKPLGRADVVALALDEFVQLVDSMGPKKEVRITRSEAAFMKQLVKKDSALR